MANPISLRVRVPVLIVGLLGGCQAGPVQEGDPGTTTLRLQSDAAGGLQACDDDGVCESVANPESCEVLVVVIEDETGRTCERCEDAAGVALSERCADTHVVCTTVTTPEPDCVVCSYDQGPVVHSTCVAGAALCDDDADCPADRVCEEGACVEPTSGPCTEAECGGPPPCRALGCADGSTVGCSCERDAQSGACSWGLAYCPDGGCSSEADCPPAQVCDLSSCASGGDCFGTCIADPDGCPPDACDYMECAEYTCADGSTGGCTSDCFPDGAGGCTSMRQCPAAECTADECGGPPPCRALLCADGTGVGCSCDRDPGSGVCGWDLAYCADHSCAAEGDCPSGELCDRSACAPADPDCFGVCVTDPDGCGPADCLYMTCPEIQCADGSVGGCTADCFPDGAGGCTSVRECPPT